MMKTFMYSIGFSLFLLKATGVDEVTEGPSLPRTVQRKTAKISNVIEVDVGKGVKMKMIYIEPGKFLMGSPKEEDGVGELEWPQHEVEITNGFYMGIFEVTQEQYGQVTGENPSEFRGNKLPVERVYWGEAMDFCERLSKKLSKTFDLPTEAEWEYACRAGSKSAFHDGKTLSSKQANFNWSGPFVGPNAESSLKKTVPVGSYQPNAFGLYDMHGNVGEWCKDWLRVNYYQESKRQDPMGPPKGDGRVYRGGGWCILGMNCRCACRMCMDEDDAYSFVGFRVVLRLAH